MIYDNGEYIFVLIFLYFFFVINSESLLPSFQKKEKRGPLLAGRLAAPPIVPSCVWTPNTPVDLVVRVVPSSPTLAVSSATPRCPSREPLLLERLLRGLLAMEIAGKHSCSASLAPDGNTRRRAPPARPPPRLHLELVDRSGEGRFF